MQRFFLAALVAASLAGCGVIYKVDVYQGSLLREENVEQLRPGLTKRQVIALLGSPAIDDPFHQERWDYVATVSKAGADPDVHNLVLTFDGDVLASIDGKPLTPNDMELMRDVSKYGNLPREDRERRGRR